MPATMGAMNFGLVQSFCVDDGSLDRETRQQAFTIGVEWGRAWELAKRPGPFTLTIHAENSERILAMLAHQGRQAKTAPATGGWMSVSVAGLD